MNKFILLLFLLGSTFVAESQNINYQAIVRRADGSPLVSSEVYLRLSVLSMPTGGVVLYRERHSATTDQYGWISISLGLGTPVSGTFMAIDWSANRTLLVECAPNAMGEYAVLGTSQIDAKDRGQKGDKGDTGAMGPAGPKGDKGDRGDAGTGFGLPFVGNGNTSDGNQLFQITQTGNGRSAISGIYGNNAVGAGIFSSGVNGSSDRTNGVTGTSSAGTGYAGIKGHGYNGSRGIEGKGNGNSIAGYFESTGSEHAGFFRSNTGAAGYFTSVSGNALITENGNVGIGTTNPSTKLDIDGQIRIRGGNPGIGKVLTSTADGSAIWQSPSAETSLLNGSGSAGHLTRWINDNTIGNSEIKQDIEGNLSIGTIPQIGYKMKINATSGFALPLNLSANNVPGAGLHFSLNDAASTAEIKLQSNITNFRTTSDKLAFNVRSASALPLTADHLAIKSNGQITMGLFEPYTSGDLVSIRGDLGMKDASINFYDDSNVSAADISCLLPSKKLHIHSISNNAGIEIISTGGSIDFATNGIGGTRNEMRIQDGKVVIGNTGIVSEPKLEVLGQVRIAGGSPGEGKVLTSSSTGFARWEMPAPSDLSLPYSGGSNALGTSFSITNVGSGNPASFKIENGTNSNDALSASTNGLGTAAFFNSTNSTNRATAVLIQTFGTGAALTLTKIGTVPGNALEINNGYIKVSGTNKTAFVHTVTANTLYSAISYPNANSTDILSVTPVWGGVNFAAPWALFWNQSQNRWEIFSQNLSTQIPSGMKFNILVIKQ